MPVTRHIHTTSRVAITNIIVTLALLAASALAGPTIDHPVPAALLLAFAAISELISVPLAKGRLSGCFGAVLVVAWMSGPLAGAIAAILVTLIDAVKHRSDLARAAVNTTGLALAATAAGAMSTIAATNGIGLDDGWFAVVCFGSYLVAICLEFWWVYSFDLGDGVDRLTKMTREVLLPLMPQFACMACVTAAVPLLYAQLGALALLLVFIVLLSFQSLVRELLISRRRAERLDESVREIAEREAAFEKLSFGALRALVQSINLRDRMTARHSGAVAKYAREIARELGCSEQDLELVHMAGLLHDVGKLIFDDAILTGTQRLTDEQFEIVKRHPGVGAELVRGMPGYEQVSDIIRHHHERIDGRGYPDGLAGDDIPLLSRCISVADTYDVMTARDSYRKPVPRADAIAELRRVSGAQLDGTVVEAFVDVLARTDLSFDHASSTDFARQLEMQPSRTRVAA